MLNALQFEPPKTPADPFEALNVAFSSFSETAVTLESFYKTLQDEVRRLRLELEERNTELRKQLEENRRIRESLHRLFEGLPCGVVLANQGGQVAFENSVARQLLGGNCGSTLPQVLGRLRGPSDLSSGMAEVQYESENFHPGDAGWLRIHWCRIESGVEEQMVFALLDTSEAKQQENRRETLVRQEALARMVVTLAHEVRNPLGSLEVFGGLLAESALNSAQRAWVEHLLAGVRLLSSTVDRVLEFHNRGTLTLQKVELEELLPWVCDFLYPIAHRTGVELAVEGQLAGIVLHADRERLRQVLLNLGLNAVREMPTGGRLLFRADAVDTEAGQQLEILVSDTGPGIEEWARARIFEPGFSTHEGSSGLGLAVCRTIIEQHQGTLQLSDSNAPGAQFRIRLPRLECA